MWGGLPWCNCQWSRANCCRSLVVHGLGFFFFALGCFASLNIFAQVVGGYCFGLGGGGEVGDDCSVPVVVLAM